MKKPKLAIWWLTQADYRGFEPDQEQNPLCIPDYAWREFCSRSGRPGGFRIWASGEVDFDVLDIPRDDPRWAKLEKLTGGDAGGIAIYTDDAEACLRWGGVVTKLDLSPLKLGKKAVRDSVRS
jgi:hypothetical protein